jgi:hypothetical protein
MPEDGKKRTGLGRKLKHISEAGSQFGAIFRRHKTPRVSIFQQPTSVTLENATAPAADISAPAAITPKTAGGPTNACNIDLISDENQTSLAPVMQPPLVLDPPTSTVLQGDEQTAIKTAESTKGNQNADVVSQVILSEETDLDRGPPEADISTNADESKNATTNDGQTQQQHTALTDPNEPPLAPALPGDPDSTRALERYESAKEKLKASLKIRRKEWGSFDFPELDALSEQEGLSTLRSEINKVLDNKKESIPNSTVWSKCTETIKKIFVAISPITKNVLTVAKEAQSVVPSLHYTDTRFLL